MRIGSYEVGYPHLLAIGLFITLFLGIAVGTTTSTATYGTYNPGWDGASGIRALATQTGAETTVIYATSDYSSTDANTSVVFIVSPKRSYSDGEVARIESFVRDGGTVVIADDFRPYSNDLLSRLGASARVNGTILRDERHNFRSGALPIATQPVADQYTVGVEQVTLNRPATVTPNGSTVLVQSSNFSYRDTDGDGELDNNEMLRSYAVATVESVGVGDIIVVSDPSFAINSMVERPDNRAFLEAIVAPHGTVLLDYSHADERPPLRVALYYLRRSKLLQLLLGTVSLSGIVLLSRGYQHQ